jgi:uncharacterized protein YbjQ (UPF0145 family)
MNRFMVTTMQTSPGYAIAKNLGVVRGLTVRSRSIAGNIVGGIQSLFGGNISIYWELCEHARRTMLLELRGHRRVLSSAIKES